MNTPAPKHKPLTAVVRDFLGSPAATETQGQRNLLQYYASRANKENRFNPGYDRITSDTGVRRTTIDTANTHFKKLGILSWLKGWGNRHKREGQSNLYTLNREALILRTFESYALGWIASMAMYGLPIPISKPSTTDSESSTTNFDGSTTDLESSTTAPAVSKYQAFEVSSCGEQAREGKPKAALSRSPQPKPNGHGKSHQHMAEDLAKDLAYIGHQHDIAFEEKLVRKLAKQLETYTPDEIKSAFRIFDQKLSNDDAFELKHAPRKFVETVGQLCDAERRQVAQRELQDRAAERASRKLKEEADARTAETSEPEDDWGL